MKNKQLFATLVGILVLVLGGIVFQKEHKQETHQTVKIGVLQYVTHDSLDQIYQGIREGLKESGYDPDTNVVLDFMNAEGNQSQVQTMSNKLVANGNQLLIGIATPAAQGLANTNSDVPIVMGAISDPVGSKLVADLKRPGGRITGVSNRQPVAAELALIQSVLPSVKTIGALYSSNEDNSKSQVAQLKQLAQEAGLTVEEFAIPSSNEIAATVEVASRKVDALYIPLDNTLASAFSTVATVANQTKTPLFTSVEDMVKAGGLASVSQNQVELGRATGRMAAKILDGADPATTPVHLFTEGEIVLNETVADALGIPLSKEVRDQAVRILK